MSLDQLPAGIPTGITNAIETNRLSVDLRDSLTTMANLRMDATPDMLQPGMGQTKSYMRLGMFDVDLEPAAPTGAIALGEFGTEIFTGKPIPYAKGFRIDGPTSYVTKYNLADQSFMRLYEWAARTSQRLARGKLFQYAGGRPIVRRAETSGATVLLVNSLAGLRYAASNGSLAAVSSTNKLAITIYAATTITGKSIISVNPLNPNKPDGPGEITLDAAVGANVAAQSYIVASNAPTVIRASYSGTQAASTEALTANYKPTLADLNKGLSKLKGRGVRPHAKTGAYHLHCDETFLPLLVQDSDWKTANQGQGIVTVLDAKALFVPSLNLLVFENNDSPAYGRGKEVSVGSSGYSGTGGAGTPASSVSMEDIGLDVVNSTGVEVRRAIITGDDVMQELFIDEELYFSQFGVQQIRQINSNLSVYAMGPMQFVSGAVKGWRLNILPALDARGISCQFSVSYPHDYVLSTDIAASSAANDLTPLKRAAVLEYGYAA